MKEKSRASRRSLGSNLRQVDAHVTQPSEYRELPRLTAAMLARGEVKRAGRPVSANPRRLITIRLPADVIAKWKASGPGWQTRMASRLSKPPRAT